MTSEPIDVATMRRRIIERDDLLHLAVHADRAASIIELGDGGTELGSDPLGAAIDVHLQVAADDDDWSVRGKAYQDAAAIQLLRREIAKRFPGRTIEADNRSDPSDLLEKACQEFTGPGLIRDLTAETQATYESIRALRLSGNLREALDRANRPPEDFAGTGVEGYRAQFEYEFTAACLEGGAGRVALGHLRESEAYWSHHERAQFWMPARSRHELSQSLINIDDGDLGEALTHLCRARDYIFSSNDGTAARTVERLSTSLSVAECAAAMPPHASRDEMVLEACAQACDQFESIRGRWGIVARSQGPLALVLRMLLGDLARIVAGVSGTPAGKLGLRISLAAKQSGFAELIRANRSMLSEDIETLVEEIVLIEEGDRASANTLDHELLARKRAELAHEASPLLGELVLPQAVDIEPVIEASEHAAILDFVNLPSSDGTHAWYRVTVNEPDLVDFDQLVMGAGYTALIENAGFRHAGGLVSMLHNRRAGASGAWSAAAAELLPGSVRARLAEASAECPVQLIISPHMQLSRIPWNALVIDDSGTRLVERAAVAQTPMLSAMTSKPLEPVTGPALVWLTDELGSSAQAAWKLGADTLAASSTIPPERHELRPGSFEENLRSSDWGLVHVTSHGVKDGHVASYGLAQGLELSTPLTAAKAIGLPWPPNVLLAACHVGAYTDAGEGEVLGFVVAAMAGGARCVVGGLHLVSRRGTGEIASRLVENLDGHTSLTHALRAAQLAFLHSGAYRDNLNEWALLAAFIR